MVTLLTFVTVLTAALATQAKPTHGGDDPFRKHTIKAKGIEASFIEYGATLTVNIFFYLAYIFVSV